MLKAFLKTLIPLFLLIAGGLYLDSVFFLDQFNHGQEVATFSLWAIFFTLFYFLPSRYKEQMFYAVLIGVAGEYLFSLGLKMYQYRLENIPHYIPPGHAIIYIAAVYFNKNTAIKLHQKLIEKIFLAIIIVFSTYFLLFKNDVFGFLLTAVVLYILHNKPRERLFYYNMYLVVAYLELVGTFYKCWEWPPYAFRFIEFLPSANPPSGISLFYFGLDLGCLWLYKKRHTVAWNRMKKVRYIKLSKPL